MAGLRRRGPGWCDPAPIGRSLVILGRVSNVFDTPRLKIEQPRRLAPSRAQYKIFNAENALVATAQETVPHSRKEALRTALPGGPVLGPQTLLLAGADETPLLTLHRDPKTRSTSVGGPEGEAIGSIRSDRTTRHYSFLDQGGAVLGTMVGDLALRRFTISDDGRQVALVRKKWAGLATEVLTKADRYLVDVTEPVGEPLRTLIAVSAIVIDLIIYENKDLV